jgi:hypothetical protein
MYRAIYAAALVAPTEERQPYKCSNGPLFMAALEEQARFFVAKYGTAAGPTGGATWAKIGPYVIPLEAVFIVIGFLLLGVLLFTILRDYVAARERSDRVRREWEAYRREADLGTI